jgi:hypothetical protein
LERLHRRHRAAASDAVERECRRLVVGGHSAEEALGAPRVFVDPRGTIGVAEERGEVASERAAGEVVGKLLGRRILAR